MNNDWPTKERDLYVAQQIMEEYAKKYNSNALGLFEIVINEAEKQMAFSLSRWVLALAGHFNALYGAHQGDFVIRQVISRCLTQGQTIH